MLAIPEVEAAFTLSKGPLPIRRGTLRCCLNMLAATRARSEVKKSKILGDARSIARASNTQSQLACNSGAPEARNRFTHPAGPSGTDCEMVDCGRCRQARLTSVVVLTVVAGPDSRSYRGSGRRLGGLVAVDTSEKLVPMSRPTVRSSSPRRATTRCAFHASWRHVG